MKKLAVFLALLVLVMGSAFAQGTAEVSADSYPSGPVSLIVPYAAGGGTDLVCRALADAAKASFPKNITVENRTGGGGAVGMSYGANAKADGSVITMITVELVTLPHTGTGAGLYFDQFKPIMMVNSAYSAITVKADAPWKTLNEFIEASKTKTMKIGNSGVGAIWHLAAAGLAKTAGVTFNHIPFDGAAPATTSLLGGHIDAITVSYAEVAAQVAAGNLRVLAVLAPERIAATPNIPTAKELGYDVAIGTWRGLGVPKDTPQPIVDKIYSIFNKAAASDSFVAFMKSTNNIIDVMDGPSYGKKLVVDNDMFKALINELGLKQQ
ncbi:tripartite tricarboxylate transporter substrate binding protein [Sphaerochaeta sp. PS]|uniref:Bug family tripartite tricarboxylate transporter substrate binding protein n=1 Tax=Sphaerochaeta sp. PS TaxID=3076336 RepID=UPI0028A335C5|nr:tripartite tricarboxylate transporter substrate binding protein [Sphaerochaeta sp. PS]MDT4762780.1 tripartite tricarboxylate transporter substrate binding protein [Sphaerochaeta sp. PS]